MSPKETGPASRGLSLSPETTPGATGSASEELAPDTAQSMYFSLHCPPGPVGQRHSSLGPAAASGERAGGAGVQGQEGNLLYPRAFCIV